MIKSTALSLSLATAALAAPHRSWSGWQTVKYMFVFGDSYTQTGFDVHGTQPNPSNPMGNPPYPGYTSSNGPNWVDFLTYTYNESYLQTYNMAYGGATVDSALVKPYTDTVVSMKSQVQDEYIPTYGKQPASAPWKSTNSLFAFFIGINDVGNSWYLNNATLHEAIVAEYASLVDQVWKTGARNFLFLNVPPVNEAPLTLASGADAVKAEGVAIADWNSRVNKMVDAFKKKHANVQAFVFDTNALYSAVIKDPNSYPQTSNLKDTTTYCEAYQNGTPQWYTKDLNCTYPVDEYLWLNNLHPTFPVHNATAASIAKQLRSIM